MIGNSTLINGVRSQGYKFKRSTDRVNFYKEIGGTKRIAIRKNSQHSPEYARTILKDAGMSVSDIEEFIAQTGRRKKTLTFLLGSTAYTLQVQPIRYANSPVGSAWHVPEVG